MFEVQVVPLSANDKAKTNASFANCFSVLSMKADESLEIDQTTGAVILKQCKIKDVIPLNLE